MQSFASLLIPFYSNAYHLIRVPALSIVGAMGCFIKREDKPWQLTQDLRKGSAGPAGSPLLWDCVVLFPWLYLEQRRKKEKGKMNDFIKNVSGPRWGRSPQYAKVAGLIPGQGTYENQPMSA